MGTQYLIDTNAAIELLGGRLPVNGSTWLEKENDMIQLTSIDVEIPMSAFYDEVEFTEE